MSGLTATGATVLDGLDALPPSINVWRCELNWLGGMGIIVLAVAMLPMLGVGGMQLYKAETPGPMKDDKLTPRITETAKGLWLVYVALTVACSSPTGSPAWTGSTRSCHSFTHHRPRRLLHARRELRLLRFARDRGRARSCSCCSRRINFAHHFLAWRSAACGRTERDPEAAILCCSRLASCVVHRGLPVAARRLPGFPDGAALRGLQHGIGRDDDRLRDTDYNAWPVFAPLWMLFLVLFVACSGLDRRRHQDDPRAHPVRAGACASSIKLVHPNAQLPVKLGGHGGTEPDRVRGAGVHVAVRRLRRRDDVAAARDRARCGHARSPRCRQHQQHRARA